MGVGLGGPIPVLLLREEKVMYLDSYLLRHAKDYPSRGVEIALKGVEAVVRSQFGTAYFAVVDPTGRYVLQREDRFDGVVTR